MRARPQSFFLLFRLLLYSFSFFFFFFSLLLRRQPTSSSPGEPISGRRRRAFVYARARAVIERTSLRFGRPAASRACGSNQGCRRVAASFRALLAPPSTTGAQPLARRAGGKKEFACRFVALDVPRPNGIFGASRAPQTRVARPPLPSGRPAGQRAFSALARSLAGITFRACGGGARTGPKWVARSR